MELDTLLFIYSNITIKWPIYFVVCLLNQNFYSYIIPRAHQSLRGCRIVHLHQLPRLHTSEEGNHFSDKSILEYD